MEHRNCKVLINSKGQYSLWPLEKALPKGWEETGAVGSIEECKAYVEENWTDIRPRSGSAAGPVLP